MFGGLQMPKENQPMNQATQRLQFEMELDYLRNAQPFILQRTEVTAEIHWKRFDELKRVGFTEEQALEIVCKRPLIE